MVDNWQPMLYNNNIISTGVIFHDAFFLLVDAQLISLTSSPQLNDSICPGTIEFTCVGTRVPIVLEWRLNDTVLGSYIFRGDTRPDNISLNPAIPGLMAQVTSVSRNQDVSTINITSTLSGDASTLEGSSVQCVSPPLSSTIYTVSVRGKTI